MIPRLCRLIVLLTLLLTPGLADARPPDQQPLTLVAHTQYRRNTEPLDRMLSRDLAALWELHQQTGGHFTPLPFAEAPLLASNGQLVAIDAVAHTNAATLMASLKQLGIEGEARWGRIVSGWLPIASLGQLGALPELAFVRPAYAWANTGRVTSQGDAAQRSDSARAALQLSGEGVAVGVLSDSYNCLGGAAGDVASGDLPSDVLVLAELAGCVNAIDEGRAMLQIVHDVAPEAPLSFHTAIGGQAVFAQGIQALADAGAEVIVDDIAYLAAPMFQDGVVAQSADLARQRGAVYLSAAGNSGRDSYEGPFRPGTQLNVGGTSYLAHDFDPGAAVDVAQALTLAPGASFALVLQWDEPFFSLGGTGAANDLDIFLVNASQTQVVEASVEANVGGDPVEILQFANPTAAPLPLNVVIGKFGGGPSPGLLKYVLFGFEGSIDEYDTASSTIYGQANAAGALAVGAAFYGDTPAFGVTPPLLEPFSSAGGTPILFDAAGRRLDALSLRAKPEIVAPDGVNTTFFTADSPRDQDTLPNFFGTSAAAPHAAGAAALVREANPGLSPSQVGDALRRTAVDMGSPGGDFESGAGLIAADIAAERVLADLSLAAVDLPAVVAPSTPLTYTIVVANEGDSALGFAAGLELSLSVTPTLPIAIARVDDGLVCTVAGPLATCVVEQLMGDEERRVTFVTAAPGTGALNIRATLRSATRDRVLANNTLVRTVTVEDRGAGDPVPPSLQRIFLPLVSIH